MLQKVIKVGNSAAVTLPKNVMEEAAIKTGDQVNVELNEATSAIIISSQAKPITNLSPDIAIWTKKFIENNKEALEELANK
ncbi:hypothetical protein A2164_01350 [Candidatus Curtissbacteria bacterium RBG_13_35_7]|uniref:SpoVT-AbrB domain-containing protein n=1 Tax=Candidatus Curtissbacteria bacterium RBG_13_35_7 TaxID=1797705 RepID=A0A1F5G4N0_9BACT|nr:MAG: hypothetical protein A2164_01350 [Candidatus Curtissbacteria bacterium RBG_13_35_7]